MVAKHIPSLWWSLDRRRYWRAAQDDLGGFRTAGPLAMDMSELNAAKWHSLDGSRLLGHGGSAWRVIFNKHEAEKIKTGKAVLQIGQW